MKRVIDYINENKKKKTIIQLLTPIFKHIKGDNVDGTFDVRYKNDAESLWNKLWNKAQEDKEIYYTLTTNGINNYDKLIRWLYDHKHELSEEIRSKLYKEKNKTWWETFKDRFSDNESHNKEENSTNKKEKDNKEDNVNQDNTSAEEKNGATTEEIVLYLSGYPKQFKTTKYYTIKFRNDDERNEKINVLKHEWKDETGENISDCNVINKENYIEKYKNHKI